MLRRRDIDKLLVTMLRSQKGVSDLFVTPGRPLQVESSGKLVPVELNPPIPAMTPYQTEMMALGLVGGDKRTLDVLAKTGSADCAYEVPGECRFRVNIFQRQKQYSIVMRKLEGHIKSIDELGIPEIFKEMAKESNGLILVTGATGSGKSTTLAAMLNEMNENRAIHILTLEDPIEFVHPIKKATFNQRELGTDFDTFANGLRAALRQAPKVILVGEMRDRTTVDIALAAASTGHLVVSTLHSIDCGQTINRIIGMFDKDEEVQIRARLAESLRFVVNQRLLRKEGGGRVAVQEIIGMNLRLKQLVLQGESKDKTYYDIIGLNQNLGWQNYDQCILEHFRAGRVSEETALANASRRAVLARAIDRVNQEGGQAPGGISLSLDTSSEECQRLMDSTWPLTKTTFPIQVDIPNEGYIRLQYLEGGVRSDGVGGQTASTNSRFHLSARILERRRRRPKGEEDEAAEIVLMGETEYPNPSICILKNFRVSQFGVNGVDRLNHYKTILEIELPLDIEMYTSTGLE